MGRFIAIVCAVVLHAGFLLFGGLLFGTDKPDKGTIQQVELVGEDVTASDKKDKPKDPTPEPKDEIETKTEEAPDAAEMIRNLEASAVAQAPALEAASLGAIEQALNGHGGGGDFADALTLSSGGRIGGTGKAGAIDEKMEKAFSLAEIDQKPQVIFQTSPLYPAEMRGRKLEGVVSVIFVVDTAGKVASPRAEKSSHPAFERPALEAVRQWKFEPALKGGQRVGCKMRVSIRFPTS